MNEQTSKKILFNKSTLFSLKAELLRKQEEVYEKKQLPKHRIENFKPPPPKPSDSDISENKVRKKSFKDNLKAVDTEELEACRKSKLALEKKAELYEHLSDSAGHSQLAGRFLVDFNTKNQQEPKKQEPIETTTHETKDVTIEDEEEWTEFTDCLGRTRKCLKTDIKLFMKRDKELMRAMFKDRESPDRDVNGSESEEVKKTTEKPLLVQTTNDYLQSLRDKWEGKERELLAKDKDIHYQDLLFDEARIHGVGYYSFSTDETERRKQMEELIKRRQETLRAQQEATQLRARRDAALAERVAAARARQRARAGLPPDEPKENEKDFTACLLEFLTQQRNEAEDKAKAEERKTKEEQEIERQKLREAYVREWDIGKEGIDDKVKKFREMTQEEYVEQQRDKRIEEFAPQQASSSNKSNHSFDDKGKILSSVNTSAPKKWTDVRPQAKTPPPPEIADLTEQKGLYFSTVKKNNKVQYKNFVKAQEPTPIFNELADAFEANTNTTEKRKYETTSTEIAPPPTYDYYGPVPKHIRTQKPFVSDIREAYAQGAKSLETKSSNRQLPQHYDFTFD